MAATITGVVYNDLNHNGQYDAGEPGLANVAVVLYNASAGCTEVRTGADGSFSLTVNAAGAYTVYEPVTAGSGCPPTLFTQPAGFTMSNTARKQSVTVTAAQVANGAVISGVSFGHDATDSPLMCSTRMIQFVGRPTVWYNINLVTGLSVLQGALSPAHDVNAIGYNPLDDYIYGYDQTTNALVRVTAGGRLIQLPLPTGLPAGNYNTGTFDANGFLYLFINDGNRFYTVDLRPNSATFLKLVNPAAGYAEQTANFGTAMSAALNISDWVYDPSDGNLYGVQRNGVLARVVPTTGQVTILTTSAPNPNASFGALAIDSTGTIYAIANNDGTVYKYTHVGNTATGVPFSTTYFASFNDGTMCPKATVRVDYGDAPDAGAGNGPGNYNTLLASNGPRHELIGSLTLGTQVTAEPDAYQNADATGDDLVLGVQDDGPVLPLPPLTPGAAEYALPVTVVNESDGDAILYGWIDFDRDGLFSAEEAAASVIVPSAPGVQTVVLRFAVPAGADFSPGETFLRLRLTTDALASTPGAEDAASVGPASDGEVEDWLLPVAAVLADIAVDKTADRSALTTGETVTYTLKVQNFGPDTAADVVLLDTPPAELADVQYSLDGGASWQPWTGSLPLGTLPSGFSASVLLRGVFTGGSGEVVNTAEVQTTTDDPDLSNNTSTVVVPVQATADLAVTKTAPPSVDAGALLTYTVTVENLGPDTAQSAVLSDTLAAALLDGAFSTDGGVTFAPWVSPYALGDLPAGSVVTLLLRGRVDPAAIGTIPNTASVLSPTFDPDLSNNTSSAATVVNEQADLSVVKLGAPKPVTPGQFLTYTITIANAGPSTAQRVVLEDAVPAALLAAEVSSDNGVTYTPWVSPYAAGDLAAGEARVLLLRGTVSASAGSAVRNTAVVSSDTPDPDPSDNTDTDVTAVAALADLAVTKAGAPNPVAAGGLLTYTLEAANLGPGDAQNVLLTDSLPAALSGAEYSLDGGAVWQPWTGALSLGVLPAGVTAAVLLRATVSPNAFGTLTNTVNVSSDTPDPDLSNNTDTALVAVNTAADLSVVKTAVSGPVPPGTLLVYTITVRNLGPDPAVNAVLTDDLPAGLSNAELSTDGGITFTPWSSPYALGTLPAGALRTLLLRAVVDLPAGVLSNTAAVSSDTPDPDPSNNTDTAVTAVGTSADLSVRKAALPDPATAGETLTYLLNVSNAGPDAAQNVVVTDPLSAALQNAEFSVQGGAFMPWTGSYAAGALAAGGSLLLTVRGRINPSFTGTLTNTVTVSSDTPDPDPENNTDTIETPVEAAADLAVVKTAASAVAQPGELFGYTVTIENLGPSDALETTLVDSLPVALENPEFSTDGGATYLPWVSPYTLGTLAAGGSRTLLFRALLRSSAVGALTNTAVVSSATPDPDPSNNSDTVVTPILPSADLSVLKTAFPAVVTAGGQLVYTLQIANAGPADAVNVRLLDALPAGLENAFLSADNGVSWQPYTGAYLLGTLAAGSVVLLLLRADVVADPPAELVNTAIVDSDTPDPNPDNNRSTVVTPAGAAADLSVCKTASPDPVAPGARLTYTIVVANAGPSTARQTVLTDVLPSGLTDAELSTDGGVTYGPWVSPYALGDLPAGSVVTLLLRAVVSASSGTLTNTVTVGSATPDPDPSNNTDTVTTAVSAGPQADVAVTKTADPTPAASGDVLVYTLTVSNLGPDSAENVVLSDTPAGLSEPEYTLDGLAWLSWNGAYAFGTMPAGQTVFLQLRGIVSAAAGGLLTNTAVVSSTTPDPDESNNTVTIVTPVQPAPPEADLVLRKAAFPDPAQRCRFVTYTLTVRNLGPSTAVGVVLSDRMPAELCDPRYYDERSRTWRPWTGSVNVGDLAPGEAVSLQLAGMLSACANAPFQNTASVTSSTPDPNAANNSASVTLSVDRCC